jgi:hypothetical protein
MINKKFIAIFGFVLLFSCTAGANMISLLYELYTLNESKLVVQGEVIEVYPQVHFTCKYRFMLGNKTYEKIGSSCGNERVGKQIPVYYSPTDPENSLNHNPQPKLIADLVFFVIVFLLFPLIAALAVYERFTARIDDAGSRSNKN